MPYCTSHGANTIIDAIVVSETVNIYGTPQ